eukprot:2844221-Lingulodinium_polyedra.AAC.1
MALARSRTAGTPSKQRHAASYRTSQPMNHAKGFVNIASPNGCGSSFGISCCSAGVASTHGPSLSK